MPTRGAVVKAEFVTHVGYRILFNVRQANGQPVPFGTMASAELESGSVTGIVGDNGDVYLSGMPEEGTFLLNWGKGNASRCTVNYHINKPTGVELVQTTAVCQQG